MNFLKAIWSLGPYFLLAALLSSCVTLQGALSSGVTIYYIGETLAPTNTIKTYYDVQDVEEKYRIIGRMTNDLILPYEADDIKDKMQEKAREVGADAIIFTDLASAHVKDELDKTIVKAIAIKYL